MIKHLVVELSFYSPNFPLPRKYFTYLCNSVSINDYINHISSADFDVFYLCAFFSFFFFFGVLCILAYASVYTLNIYNLKIKSNKPMHVFLSTYQSVGPLLIVYKPCQSLLKSIALSLEAIICYEVPVIQQYLSDIFT